MKIKTQFILNLIVLSIILLVILILTFYSNQQILAMHVQQDLAERIERDAYDLSQAADDFLLYRESQQASRWQAQFASFSSHLANIEANSPEKQNLLTNLQRNRDRLQEVFAEIHAAIQQTNAVPGGALDPSFFQIGWSRLEVQTQGLIFEASRFAQLLRDEENQIHQRMNLFGLALIGVFGVLLSANYSLTSRYILKALADLQTGTQIVGTGNLNYVIPVKRKDEIGELAQAFNRMSVNLQGVTASKAELEHTQSALRESEARLRSVHDSMSEGLADHTIVYQNGRAVDYVITDVNPAYERITGLVRAQAAGKKASELYGMGEPPYLDVYAAVAESGAPASFETYFEPMDKNFAISAFSPQKGRFATVFMDITARKHAEEAIQRERDLLQAVMNGAKNSHLVYLDRDFNFVRVNETYAQTCGYRPAEMIGKNHFALYPHTENEAIFTRVRDSGEPAEFHDKPFVFPDQPERGVTYWDWTLTPVKDLDDQVVGLILSLFETTAHKRTEERLRQLHSAVEQSPASIVITDVQGNIEYINPQFTEITGYTFEDVRRQNPRILQSGKTPPQVYEQLWNTIMGGADWRGELLNRKKNSALHWESVSISPIMSDGTITHFVAVKQDITERKQAEEALRQLNIELEHQTTQALRANEELKDARRAALNMMEDALQARDALRHAHAELEQRVRERTHELAESNRALRAEIIERQQAEDRATRYATRAETLAAANLALTQTLDLDQVLGTLLDFLCRLIPYDSANVMLLENETQLNVYASRGYEQRTDPALIRAIKFDISSNRIFQKMLATKASVLVADTRLEPDWERKAGIEYVHSWLGVPLIAGGKVIGLYSLDHAVPAFFTEWHRELAEAFAPQAAVAIQNAWLFQQVQAGRERLQALSRRLVEVQENERRYIARELHDDVSQTLTSLMVGLKLLETQSRSPTIATRVAELKHTANDILENLHRIATDLRPASLEHLGLLSTLAQHIANLNLKHDNVIQFEAIGMDGIVLTPALETALYRIAQETLNNALQHAHSTHIDVLLEQRAQRIILLVEDNGVGFDPDAALKRGRLGLVGLRERVEMLNGDLRIESSPGKGTTLRVEIPYGN